MTEALKRPDCRQCGKPMISRGHKAESGRQRWRCKPCNTSTTAANDDFAKGYDEALVAENNARLKELVRSGHKRFVITAAMNNTRLHRGFWDALATYCEHNDAHLIVLPVHYKNISLYTAGQQFKKTWPAEVERHLIDERVSLGGGLDVSPIKVAATAANPLEGLNEVGGNRWQVIGHSQVAMEPVGAPMSERPKRLYTTGMCTVKNYSQTKQGAKAEFHHSNAALVVEVAGRQRVFCRHIHAAKGGAFYDVAGGEVKHYQPGKVAKNQSALALTTGDEHVKFHDRNVYQATYGKEGIVAATNPQYLIRHDVLDGYAGSHHHEKHPLVQFKKAMTGDNDYRAELDQVVEFIDKTTPDGCTTVMVDSNHHDHLQQWLDRADANKDHTNALLIAELQLAQRKAILAGRDHKPLRLYCEPRLQSKVKWLGRNDDFRLKGVDYTQHGDKGVNGARGSAKGLARTTYKMVIGHSHSPRIAKGVYQSGKSCGRMEYEAGLSTQSRTHCLQYPDGKRTLIDIYGTQWRGV